MPTQSEFMRIAMQAVRDVVQSGGDYVAARLRCPSCGRPMHVGRMVSRAGDLPPLRTFSCGECGVSITEGSDRG